MKHHPRRAPLLPGADTFRLCSRRRWWLRLAWLIAWTAGIGAALVLAFNAGRVVGQQEMMGAIQDREVLIEGAIETLLQARDAMSACDVFLGKMRAARAACNGGKDDAETHSCAPIPGGVYEVQPPIGGTP